MERLAVGEQPYVEPSVLTILLKEMVGSECRRGGVHEIINEEAHLDFPVAVDRELFRVLLRNLIDNACLYSPSGTPIQVQAAQRDKNAFVAVLDLGPGISEEELPLIFQPYYRSPKVSEILP